MEDEPRFRPDADYHDEEWLREQLKERGRSPADIAEECGVTPSSVRSKRDHFDIEPGRPYRDGDWLERKHHGERMTTDDIAYMAGVTNQTIVRHMERNDVERWDKHTHGSESGSEGKKRIEVEPEHFEKLREEKPEGVPWGEYLAQMRTMD